MKLFKKYEHKRLSLMASYCTGKNVLDLGYAQLPNPYFSNIHRTGLDLESPKSIGIDGSPLTKYEETLIGDVTKINDILIGRSFDNIVAGEFIEHIENPYDFLRSLKPLLSKSGRLVISTPNPISFPVLFFETIRSKKLFYTTDHKYYFTPRWVERILTDCGYIVTEVKGVGLWNPALNIPAPVALSYQVIYVAISR